MYKVDLVYIPCMTEASKKSERITTMMAPTEVSVIDAWRRKQDDIPSRGEAIRRLIEQGLDVSLPADVSAEIDSYRSALSIPTRAAAISRLIAAGLKSERNYHLSKRDSSEGAR